MERFADLLVKTADVTQVAERNRLSLCSLMHFELETVYFRLDQSGHEKIGIQDLKEFFIDNFVNPTRAQLEGLLGLMDIDLDGWVSPNDFESYILPARSPLLKDTTKRKQPYFIEKRMYLPSKVEKQLCETMQFDMLAEELLYELRAIVLSDLTELHIFQDISKNKQAFSFNDFNLYVTSRDIAIDPEKVSLLFKGMDYRSKGSIDFLEFVQYLFRPRTAPQVISYQTPSKPKGKQIHDDDVYTQPKRVAKRELSSIDKASTVKTQRFNKVEQQQRILQYNPQEEDIYDMLKRSLIRQIKEFYEIKELISLQKNNRQSIGVLFDDINNHANGISLKILQEYIQRLGNTINHEDLNVLFQRYDLNRDGLLDELEFRMMLDHGILDAKPRNWLTHFIRKMELLALLERLRSHIEQTKRCLMKYTPISNMELQIGLSRLGIELDMLPIIRELGLQGIII